MAAKKAAASTDDAPAKDAAADTSASADTAAAKADSKDSKGKKLTANVYVDGELYAAGSRPPADVAKRITNEKAWA